MATTPLGIDQAPRAQSRAHVSNNVWPHGLTPPSRGLRYSPALGPPTPRTPAIPGPPVPVGAAHGPFSCSSSAIHAPPRSSRFRFLPSPRSPPHLTSPPEGGSSASPNPRHGERVGGGRALLLVLPAGQRRGRAAAAPAPARRLRPAPHRLRLLQRRHGRHRAPLRRRQRPLRRPRLPRRLQRKPRSPSLPRSRAHVSRCARGDE